MSSQYLSIGTVLPDRLKTHVKRSNDLKAYYRRLIISNRSLRESYTAAHLVPYAFHVDLSIVLAADYPVPQYDSILRLRHGQEHSGVSLCGDMHLAA